MIGRGCFSGVCVAIAALFLAGCAHTLPERSNAGVSAVAGKGLTIGIGGFQDVNGFDYSAELRDDLQRRGGLAAVLETANVMDPLCDLVIVGNFSHSSVKTRTGFFYTSIYFLLVPALSGLPTSYLDGEFVASFDVYRSGRLVRTLQYENVCREPRSYLTIYPSSTRLSSQMARMAGHLVADLRSMGL